MGVAGLLAGDGAQAKALAGVEAGRLQPAVIEAEALRLAVFQEKLAVIGAMQGIADQPVEAGALHFGPGEKQGLGKGRGGYGHIVRYKGRVGKRSRIGGEYGWWQ